MSSALSPWAAASWRRAVRRPWGPHTLQGVASRSQCALPPVAPHSPRAALPIAVILVCSPFISCSSACSGLLDITWLQFHPPWYHSPVCGQPVQRLGCPARPQSALLPGCECPRAVVTLLPAPCTCWAESCLQSCLCLLCVFSPKPQSSSPWLPGPQYRKTVFAGLL